MRKVELNKKGSTLDEHGYPIRFLYKPICTILLLYDGAEKEYFEDLGCEIEENGPDAVQIEKAHILFKTEEKYLHVAFRTKPGNLIKTSSRKLNVLAIKNNLIVDSIDDYLEIVLKPGRYSIEIDVLYEREVEICINPLK